jgi:hypothetical protein
MDLKQCMPIECDQQLNECLSEVKSYHMYLIHAFDCYFKTQDEMTFVQELEHVSAVTPAGLRVFVEVVRSKSSKDAGVDGSIHLMEFAGAIQQHRRLSSRGRERKVISQRLISVDGTTNDRTVLVINGNFMFDQDAVHLLKWNRLDSSPVPWRRFTEESLIGSVLIDILCESYGLRKDPCRVVPVQSDFGLQYVQNRTRVGFVDDFHGYHNVYHVHRTQGEPAVRDGYFAVEVALMTIGDVYGFFVKRDVYFDIRRRKLRAVMFPISMEDLDTLNSILVDDE